MFKVTETVVQEDSRQVSSATGPTVGAALDRVLDKSPRNSNITKLSQLEVADDLSGQGRAMLLRTEFTCERM